MNRAKNERFSPVLKPGYLLFFVFFYFFSITIVKLFYAYRNFNRAYEKCVDYIIIFDDKDLNLRLLQFIKTQWTTSTSDVLLPLGDLRTPGTGEIALYEGGMAHPIRWLWHHVFCTKFWQLVVAEHSPWVEPTCIMWDKI